jgi:hypothetical protein
MSVGYCPTLAASGCCCRFPGLAVTGAGNAWNLTFVANGTAVKYNNLIVACACYLCSPKLHHARSINAGCQAACHTHVHTSLVRLWCHNLHLSLGRHRHCLMPQARACSGGRRLDRRVVRHQHPTPRPHLMVADGRRRSAADDCHLLTADMCPHLAPQTPAASADVL